MAFRAKSFLAGYGKSIQDLQELEQNEMRLKQNQEQVTTDRKYKEATIDKMRMEGLLTPQKERVERERIKAQTHLFNVQAEEKAKDIQSRKVDSLEKLKWFRGLVDKFKGDPKFAAEMDIATQYGDVKMQYGKNRGEGSSLPSDEEFNAALGVKKELGGQPVQNPEIVQLVEQLKTQGRTDDDIKKLMVDGGLNPEDYNL